MNSLILALELKTCRSNPIHHYSSEHRVLFFKPVLRIWEDWIAYLYALFLKSKNTFKKKFFLKKNQLRWKPHQPYPVRRPCYLSVIKKDSHCFKKTSNSEQLLVSNLVAHFFIILTNYSDTNLVVSNVIEASTVHFLP